jgi:signal transduction histidine kinase/ligand-binding sensor domain-containing protein
MSALRSQNENCGTYGIDSNGATVCLTAALDVWFLELLWSLDAWNLVFQLPPIPLKTAKSHFSRATTVALLCHMTFGGQWMISRSLQDNCQYTMAVTAANSSLLRRILLFAAITFWMVAPQFIRAESAVTTFPQDLTLRAWTKQQGLPDDSVTSVLQTHDGFLWVGTSSGLARFDGMRFAVMTPQNVKSNSAFPITALCEDTRGKLWIGTQQNGLLCYEDGVVNPCSQRYGFTARTITSIAEDSRGALWIGTPTGLARLENSAITHFTTKDGLPNDFVSNVHVARSGTIWITTHGGICQFKDNNLEPVPFQIDSPSRNPESLGVYEDRRGKLWAFGDTYLVNFTDNKHLNHFGSGDATRIWSLCEGGNGELWIGTSGKGLYCFADNKFVPVMLHNGEITSDVRAICEDRQGNLWLGTHSDGLVRLQPRNVSVMDAIAGLPNRSPVCLAVNSEGRAWIGFDRAGLYEGSAGNFAQFPARPGLQNLISSVCVAPDSNLWVGTPGAGLYCVSKQRILHLTTADGLSDNKIVSLAADADGSVWVGTASRLHRISNGAITTFGESEGLPNRPVTAIYSASKAGVLFGFEDGSVFRESHGQFRQVIAAETGGEKPIRALFEDSGGRVWIGTAGRMGCLVGNRFLDWNLPSGTTDKYILGILGSEDGDLWFSTDRSVYSIAQKELNSWLSNQSPFRPQLIYRAESVADVSRSYGWPRAVRSSAGALWFATDSGIVTVNSASPVADSTPPPVFIEEISVNGKTWPRVPQPISPTAKANLPARFPSKVRSLDIHFTALDLSAPEKIRFRHRLEGSDSDWVMDGELTREVHYPLLAYGPYTFHVQAGSADQEWFGNEATFNFIIPTPLWRTQWAFAVYIITGLILVGALARVVLARRYRHRLAVLGAQQAMERERMRIARDMHDEIGSKLTKISFMSELAKRELDGQNPVAQKLDSIAGTSRDLLQTLDEIVWAVNPHNDTLEHLAAYLGQYATEYLQNTPVECELHIPRGLPHHPLSAEARHNLFLAFEEALNNALKHGRASRLRVDMQIGTSQFEITIEDNGCGFDTESTKTLPDQNGAANSRSGYGLRNMRQRLELLGGRCTIRSSAGHGTTVILSVPLAPAVVTKTNGSKA